MSNESVKKKDFWDKFGIFAKIAIPVVIAITGWYLSHIYQIEQRELNKTQIEMEILKTAINGNEFEKKLAIDFASAVAEKFKDKEFVKIILGISLSEGNSEAVRIKAQKQFLKISTSDPNPMVRDTAQKTLLEISLKEALESGDNFYKVEHFYKAATDYEKATSFVPFHAKVDLTYLEEARKNIDSDPETACNQYRKFFLPLR